MVFKPKGGYTYKLKVAIPGQSPRTFSTGSTDKGVASDVERMVERMKGRREWATLDALFDGLFSLAELYDADVSGTVDALVARALDVDLDPLVTEWSKRAFWRYIPHVRLFIPEGERFPASAFRRKAISEFLAELPCSDPTKNRYRASLSVFAKWLVEREVLDTNPVRDVAMYKERDPRMVWMTWEDAERVANAAPLQYRVLFALMAATGMELGAALKLTRADINFDRKEIFARGSKTAWRNRVVRIEPFAHAVLEEIPSGLIGAAPLFHGVGYAEALRVFKAAQQAVGLSGHRLHDLRHTYAVNALRKGYKPQTVAHQLGHKDASMVLKCYGRFIPDASDYAASGSTESATTPKKQREVKRAK